MSNHKITVDGVEAIHVPIRTQPNRENECLLYALEMVLTYCSEVHPAESIRENSVLLTAEDLKEDHITIRESGWSPSPDDFKELSESLGVINLEMDFWSRSPPMNAFENIIEYGLERNMPTIAVVDAKMIQGLNSTDGQHAVVVTGLTSNHVVIANPWGSSPQKLKKGVVRDAWDTELNRLITLDASRQESLTSQEELEASV